MQPTHPPKCSRRHRPRFFDLSHSPPPFLPCLKQRFDNPAAREQLRPQYRIPSHHSSTPPSPREAATPCGPSSRTPRASRSPARSPWSWRSWLATALSPAAPSSGARCFPWPRLHEAPPSPSTPASVEDSERTEGGGFGGWRRMGRWIFKDRGRRGYSSVWKTRSRQRSRLILYVHAVLDGTSHARPNGGIATPRSKVHNTVKCLDSI